MIFANLAKRLILAVRWQPLKLIANCPLV